MKLSYCWGTDQPTKLTMAKLPLWKLEIPVSKLPQSLQGAIFLARWLGIRLWWIDSWCIIQDNLADKAKEISKMQIYHSLLYNFCCTMLRKYVEITPTSLSIHALTVSVIKLTLNMLDVIWVIIFRLDFKYDIRVIRRAENGLSVNMLF